MKDKLPRVAFFCTMGSSAGKTFNVMEELTSKHPLATAEMTTSEIKSGAYKEKAKNFAEVIGKAF
jgi:hypothetical protein